MNYCGFPYCTTCECYRCCTLICATLALQVTAANLRKAKLAANKGLSALSDCICSLANGSRNCPYRTSRLTAFLEPYLGGAAKTLMLVTLAPERRHIDESLSSLYYANKVNSCNVGLVQRQKTQTKQAKNDTDKPQDAAPSRPSRQTSTHTSRRLSSGDDHVLRTGRINFRAP